MKNIIILFIILFIFVSCSEKEKTYKKKEKRVRRIAHGYKEKICKNFSLIEDSGLFFYRVEKGDCLIEIAEKIRRQCGKKFSYLKYSGYKREMGFNIPGTVIHPGFLLALPLKKEVRIVSKSEFLKASGLAVKEMLVDPIYGEKLKKVLLHGSIEELKRSSFSFAMAESELGLYALNRWEKGYQAYSFSYFHILMGAGSPGFRARINLGLTEGDVVTSPKNSVKLFIAYWFEKNRGKYKKCLILKERKNIRECGKIYNGSFKYSRKLKKFFDQY